MLQHALMRTWAYWDRAGPPGRPLDLPDYEAIGTMKEALSRHAEEAYAEVGKEGRHAAEVLFRALTDTASDSRGVRRPTSVEEVAQIAEVPADRVIAVADLFRRRSCSFLTPPPDVTLGPHSVLDISHESLMRGWKRLIAWAEQERVAAAFYARLARAAAWHEQGTAALWRDPELALGLRWREENRPNKPWADRYDEGFDRTVAFLERSAEERDRAVALVERERRQKLRRARQVAGALAALLVLSIALALYARRQQLRAGEQFARADRNLTLAMTAVDEMLMSAGRQSARVAAEVPEFEEFRRELLEKAESFYAAFGAQKPDSEALQRDGARAHFRLGDIYRLLVRPDEAREHYDEASRRFSALAQQHPGNPEYRQSLANVQNWLGELLRPLDGGASDAEAAYARALSLQTALHEEFPADAGIRQELARTHYNLGILRWERGGGGGRGLSKGDRPPDAAGHVGAPLGPAGTGPGAQQPRVAPEGRAALRGGAGGDRARDRDPRGADSWRSGEPRVRIRAGSVHRQPGDYAPRAGGAGRGGRAEHESDHLLRRARSAGAVALERAGVRARPAGADSGGGGPPAGSGPGLPNGRGLVAAVRAIPVRRSRDPRSVSGWDRPSTISASGS